MSGSERTTRRSTIHILVVCTAGRCRSPIAAALLEQRLGRGSQVNVTSGGLRPTGEPMPDIGVSLMAERGIDLADHVSIQVTADSIAEADLVLAMTREHVREIVGISADAWPKTFTLKEFVRRAEEHRPRGGHQRVSDWLGGIGAGRDPYDVLGADPDDDVVDPFGQQARAWNQVIEEIGEFVGRAVPVLGVSRPGSRAGGGRFQSPVTEPSESAPALRVAR